MIRRKKLLNFLFPGGVFTLFLFFAIYIFSQGIDGNSYPDPRKYAPNFLFDSQEKYYPADPLKFYYDSNLNEISGYDAIAKYNELALENKLKNFVIFYNIKDSGSDLVYQYWLFYVLNDAENDHFGDWEFIQAYVDKSDLSVKKILASAHTGTTTKIFLAHGEVLEPKINNINILVEEGSHANCIDSNGDLLFEKKDHSNWYNSYCSYFFAGWSKEDRDNGIKVFHDSPYYKLNPLSELENKIGDKDLISKEKSPSLGMAPLNLPFKITNSKLGIQDGKFYALKLGGAPPENAWKKKEYHDPEKASPITVTKIAKAVNEKVKAGVDITTKLAKITFERTKDRVVTTYRNVKNTAQLAFERIGDSMRTAFDEAKRAFGGRRDVARTLQAGLPFALNTVNTKTSRPGSVPNVSLAATSGPSKIGDSNLKPIPQSNQPVVEESQATDTDPIDSNLNSGFMGPSQGNSGGVEEEPIFISDPELNFDTVESATDTNQQLNSDLRDPEINIRIGPDNSFFEEPLSSEPIPVEPVLPEIPEEPEVIPPPEPPSDEPLVIDSRAVVINEIAWMGTEASGEDQWIELHNTSNQDISLEGWKVSWVWVLAFGMTETTEVWLSGTIPAHGYYLMERCIPRFEELHGGCDYAVSDIPADLIYNEVLSRIPSRPVYMRLWNSAGEAVDWADMWYAGSDMRGSMKTMERVSPYVWNHNANWLSASAGGVTGLDANENAIIGTPKAQNSVYGRYTIIQGSYHEDITLYRDRSPYLIYESSLGIEAGATLTIEPGVVVRAYSSLGNTGIEVYGTIRALGTEDAPIVFTSDLDSDYGGSGGAVAGVWKGIRVSSESPNSIFDYTIIRYAGYYPPGFENSSIALLIQNAPILFRNSVVEYSRTKGLWLSYSASVIESSLFQNNVIAIFSDNVGDIQATIRNSIFRNNVVHLWVQDGLEPIQEGNIFE